MDEQKQNKTMTKAEKVQANLSAIKLVKALEADNRLADSAEQEILSNYVGWGGLANDFFERRISCDGNELLDGLLHKSRDCYCNVG